MKEKNINNTTRITIEDYNKESFIKLYQFLFIEPYINMSNDSKIMYSLLRDRFNLSVQNNWVNKNGEIYLIYSNKELVEIIKKSEPTIIKIKKELASYYLLEEEQQGQKKPNLLFLKADSSLELKKFKYTDFKNLKNFSSRTKKTLVQELKKLKPNHTKVKQTYIRHTKSLNEMTDIELFNQSEDEITRQFKYYSDGSIKQYLKNENIDFIFQQFLSTRSKPLNIKEIIIAVKSLEEYNFNEWIQYEMILESISNERRKIVPFTKEELEAYMLVPKGNENV